MTTHISMLAIDLAKGSFQVCAVGPEGTVLYNRSLSRTRLATLLADQPACIVAMEACATSHHWGRVAQRHGHEVRLVPAAYVKPFVKRQSEAGMQTAWGAVCPPNDKADAEAIAEAALRPTMRFVAVKSAETQGRAVAFRTHQCLVRQRTQLTNALRGHPLTDSALPKAMSREVGRIRPCGAEGTREPEGAGERVERRGHGPAIPGSGDGNNFP
ncbi:IS110 family transposase [Sagittula sp. SSi028]|uniref:IS110 family transposase n=1 Tax=Sagittula sp. SSi028 TaxID=3400636 RepID=UPI003AF40E7A